MSNYILALDQGTTSSRAILFDQAGHVRGRNSGKSFRIQAGSNMIPKKSGNPSLPSRVG
jgi:glycerol kinase